MPVSPEELKKSIQARYELILAWEINAATDFIYEMDLLKILLLCGIESRRKEILCELQIPEVYTSLLPLHNPQIIKKADLKVICDHINSGKILSRIERAKLKLKYIEELKKPPVQFQNSNQVYDEIAAISPFYFLSQHLGFQPVKGKNSSNWLDRIESKTANGIEIASPNGKSYLLYNVKETGNHLIVTRDGSFSGGLLQFIIKEVLGYADVHDSEAKKAAIDYIKARQNLSENPSLKTPVKEYIKIEETETKFDNKIYGKLEFPAYLLSRGLTMKVLSSTLFKGLIGNVEFDKIKGLRNVYFKMRNRAGETTYLEKNKAVKGVFQKGVSTIGMLFKSHKGTGAIDTLIFAETAIDLLSKIELEGGIRKTAIYVSSNGQLNSDQLEHLIDIIYEKNIAYVEINQDNDLQGRLFTNKILYKLVELIPNEIPSNEILQLQSEYNQIPSDEKEQRIKSIDKINQLLLNQINHNMQSSKLIRLFTPKGKDFNEDLMAMKGLSRNGIEVSKMSN
jgi:hypothetical protein